MNILTPQQLRERLVEFYMNSFKRAYGNAERASIERKVVADLELVDSHNRLAQPKRDRVRRPAPPRNRAAQVGSQAGMTVAKTAEHAQRYRPDFLHKNPMLVSERWGAATARMVRILQGSWGSTLTDAVKNSEVPKLSKEILDTYAAYMLRGRPAPLTGVDRNPFRDLSDKDAARLFMRKIEDICDRSTKYLGSWYVK